MAKFKAEGLKPGVSDILYLQPRGTYAYLAIEMKAQDRRNQKDGGVSLEQYEFLEEVEKNGGMALCCYSCDEALDAFYNYMNMKVKN